MIRTAAISCAVVALGLGCGAAGYFLGAASEPRYRLITVDGDVYRMDTRSGALDVCGVWGDDTTSCVPVRLDPRLERASDAEKYGPFADLVPSRPKE